jgi:hypothetical protein
MKPEEQLEHLIQMRQSGKQLSPTSSKENLSRLAAVDSLARLGQIEVPSDFAARLEGDLRQHVRHIAQKNSGVTRSRWRIDYLRPRFVGSQSWITGLGIAAVLLLACISVIAIYAQNLPGYSLSHLQQPGHQSANKALEKSKISIEQLHKAIDDLSGLVNTGCNDNKIEQAVGLVITKTNDSRADVTNIPVGPEHKQMQHNLDNVLSDEEHVLYQLLPHVDWSVKLAFTQQLSKLGHTVPVITNAVVSKQSDETILITVSGTNFMQQTSLVINGQVEGTIIKITSLQLVAVLKQSNWPQGVYAIGVLGPDSTATQIMVNVSHDLSDQQDSSEHHRDNDR